jgi:hydroxymethylpyrimidine/phosphomethylpyrimidine kinase
VRAFPGTFLPARNPRGTGCVYASAIATQLARGTNLEDSIAASKAFVAEALLTELPLGAGRGPTDPLRVARR